MAGIETIWENPGMRHSLLVAMILSAWTTSAPAQQQPQPPAPQGQVPLNGLLDQYLGQWQDVMAQVKNLEADCTRIDFDKAFQSTTTWTGKVKFAQPNRAYMKLDKKGGKPEDYEHIVSTGQFVYNLYGAAKTVYVYELPKPQQPVDSSVMELLFNIKASEVKSRYAISLGQADQNYVYIFIKSLKPEDKAQFKEARLALQKNNFLLRELWFVEEAGNEVKWTVSNIKINAPMDVKDFAQPAVPRDWKVERSVQPRIVREKQ